MINSSVNRSEIVCSDFTEFTFFLPQIIVHPKYALDMHLPALPGKLKKVPANEKRAYNEQLYEKFLLLPECEYVPLIQYTLYKIADRREWLEACILLIVNNRDLFLVTCSLEKYTYLFSLLTELFDVTMTDSQSLLFENCEECYHRTKQRIFHDIKMLRSLPHGERTFFLRKIVNSIRQFERIKNLNFDDVMQELLELDELLTEEDAVLKKELSDHRLSLENSNLSGLKKISVNCSAVEFGPIMGDFMKNTKNKDGVYLFEYDNTRLSKWTEAGIYFKYGSQVCAKTLDDYWPSVRKKNF